MSPYRYPDYDDRNLLANVINKDWEDQGLEIQYIQEAIQHVPTSCRIHLLDIGCGQGRLLPIFEKYFECLVAIDADPYRLNNAKNALLHSQNIFFLNAFIQDFSCYEQFDFIVCSHLIQHMLTDEVENILVRIRRLMKPKAYLMLSTTNWPDSVDQFEIRNTLNNQFEIVSEKEFNDCVAADDRRLPTRHFSENTLRQLLAKTKFNILFLKKYHGFPKVRGDNFILATRQEDD